MILSGLFPFQHSLSNSPNAPSVPSRETRNLSSNLELFIHFSLRDSYNEKRAHKLIPNARRIIKVYVDYKASFTDSTDYSDVPLVTSQGSKVLFNHVIRNFFQRSWRPLWITILVDQCGSNSSIKVAPYSHKGL
jgi:hypothetical protein